MNEIFQRFGTVLGAFFIAIVTFWLICLVVIPNLTMLDFALRPNLPPSQAGSAKDIYSADNFFYLWNHRTHGTIFLKTVWSSALVTLMTFVLCYPLAYWLAQVATMRKTAFVLLILMIPYMMNEVLRGLAWFILLAYEGPLNALMINTGLLSEPMRWYGDGGVIAGMAYAYLLFMLFPMYNLISTLEHAQIDAARDMGASTWQIHRRIVLPHAKVGIATGCVFTFMLSAGSYMAPALLGAPGSRWFTQLIYDWFFESGNWNRGAAYAVTLLMLCMIVVLGTLRLFRVNLASAIK